MNWFINSLGQDREFMFSGWQTIKGWQTTNQCFILISNSKWSQSLLTHCHHLPFIQHHQEGTPVEDLLILWFSGGSVWVLLSCLNCPDRPIVLRSRGGKGEGGDCSHCFFLWGGETTFCFLFWDTPYSHHPFSCRASAHASGLRHLYGVPVRKMPCCTVGVVRIPCDLEDA